MYISQDDLLDLLDSLDYYCAPALRLLSHDQVQFPTGLETPMAVLAKDIDPHYRFTGRYSTSSSQCDYHRSPPNPSTQARLERHGAGILRRVVSDEQANELVTGWFVAMVAQVLGLDTSEVDSDKPMHTYGIGSLDPKSWFARKIHAEVQV